MTSCGSRAPPLMAGDWREYPLMVQVGSTAFNHHSSSSQSQQTSRLTLTLSAASERDNSLKAPSKLPQTIGRVMTECLFFSDTSYYALLVCILYRKIYRKHLEMLLVFNRKMYGTFLSIPIISRNLHVAYVIIRPIWNLDAYCRLCISAIICSLCRLV